MLRRDRRDGRSSGSTLLDVSLSRRRGGSTGPAARSSCAVAAGSFGCGDRRRRPSQVGARSVGTLCLDLRARADLLGRSCGLLDLDGVAEYLPAASLGRRVDSNEDGLATWARSGRSSTLGWVALAACSALVRTAGGTSPGRATLAGRGRASSQRRGARAPRSTRSPTAAAASAAMTGSSSSSAAALPGDTVRARVTKVKRGFAEGVVDASSSRPSALARRRAVPALSGSAAAAASRTSPTSVQLAEKARQVRDALVAHRAASPSRRSSRSCRPRRSSATATSSSTRSRQAEDGLDARLPSRRPLGRGASGSRSAWLTTDLGNAIRLAVRDWAREERLEAYDQATGRGLPPPPRRPRGAEHRAGARRARDRARRALRGGLLRRRAATVPGGALDPLGDQRHARRA